MSLLLKDRVKESTTTTGTGTLTLVAAPSGYRRFSAALSDGDTTYYCIESGSNWEVGLGTYSANTLTRDTVLASSNSGSKINITASRSYVFITYAADKAVLENAAGEIRVDSALRFSDNSSQSTAFLGAVDYDGIANVPANSLLGNNTGSAADAIALDASASRTLLGLSTSDSPTFAGLTLTGNLLFGTTNSYDIGNGTYDPRSVYAATSVLTPAVSNTASQLTLTGGPDAGYFSLASVVLKNTASANDYARFYGVGGTSLMALHAGGASPGHISYAGSTGALYIVSQVTPGNITLKTGSTGAVYAVNSSNVNTTVIGAGFVNDAAATTLGNSTYGVTVPGAIAASGNVSVTKATTATLSATSGTRTAYVDAWQGDNVYFRSVGAGCWVGTHDANELVLYTDSARRVTVSSTGALTTTGDISMSKTSAQGYIRAYYTDGVKNVAVSHNGSNGVFATSSGANTFTSGTGQNYFFDSTGAKYLLLNQSGNVGVISTNAGGAASMQIATDTGQTSFYSAASNSSVVVFSAAGAKYTTITHDGNNGTLSTSANGIKLAPATGTVELWGVNGVGTGTLRVYNQTNTSALSFAGGNSEHSIYTTAGSIAFQPVTGNTICYTVGTNSTFRVYDSSAAKYTQSTHDGTNGILSTSSGALYLSAQNGFVRAYTSGVQSYLQAWDGTLTGTTWVTHSGTTGELQTNVGALQITTATGVTQLLKGGTDSSLRVYAGGATKYTAVTHNDTDGIISTSSGNLNLVPTGGTVAVTGAGSFSRSVSGSTQLLTVENTSSSTVNNHAVLTLTTTGAGGGSPYVTFRNIGNFVWSAGIDNADGDSFKICESGALSAFNYFKIASAGAATFSSSVTCAGITASGTVGISGANDGGTGAKLFVATGIYTPGFIYATGGLSLTGSTSITGSGQNIVVTGYLQLANGGPILNYVNSSSIQLRNSANSAYADLVCAGITASGAITTGSTETVQITHNTTNGVISTSSGEIILSPWGGTTSCYVSGTNSTLFVKGATGTGYIALAHNDTSYGQLAVSTGDLLFTATSSLFCFGGRTSSYPAIKRSGATIAFKLADDSADAPITAAMATFSKSVLQSAEVTGTPSGTTQTLTLNDGNYQTLDLTSSTGDVTVTLTVPTSSAKGSILIKQHATTSRDIAWAVSAGSIIWLGTEPTWNADATSSYREVSWRFNGTDIFLSASGVS